MVTCEQQQLMSILSVEKIMYARKCIRKMLKWRRARLQIYSFFIDNVRSFSTQAESLMLSARYLTREVFLFNSLHNLDDLLGFHAVFVIFIFCSGSIIVARFLRLFWFSVSCTSTRIWRYYRYERYISTVRDDCDTLKWCKSCIRTSRRSATMHELFTQVLSKRDLSKVSILSSSSYAIAIVNGPNEACFGVPIGEGFVFRERWSHSKRFNRGDLCRMRDHQFSGLCE